MPEQQQHHQPSPARPLKRSEPPSPSSQGDGLLPAASTSAHTAQSTGGLTPAKRKITRRRQIFSCRACTTRKIRCEREGGPGTPCKACEKRGESHSCDAGSALALAAVSSNGGSASGTCADSCAEHRDELERRIHALEAAVMHGHRPRSSRSAASNNGFGGTQSGYYADGPDSETEDAAMTLEDIAVNVRIGQQQPRRANPGASTPFAGAAAGAPPLAPPPGVSRERASLLVPEIAKRFQGVLADLYATLPSQAKMDWLVSMYFGSLSWFWVAHHAPTFLAEYDAFRHLLQEGKQFEIDPLWLAVLFLTLAHAANSLDYVPPGSDFTAEELTSMVPDFFEAARAALDCGDAWGAAKLRSIQAVVLLGPLALNSGDPGRVDVLMPYVAANIRIAQQLRLDKLGSDPLVMPPPDPALPGGTNTLRREVALRLFHALLHIDQVIFRTRPVLPMHLVSCAMPGNFDDKDLRSDAIVPPHPAGLRTIAAYETLRFRVGMVQRSFHDDVILDPSYEYSTVLKNDTEMRNLIAEYDLERPEPGETTPMFWARVFSLQNIHIRLIRFHRPFMSRGYREPMFRTSTDAALAAARVVLETQKELDRTCAPLVKDCYQLNHIQVAVVVLFLDIWTQHDPERQVPTADYRLVSDASLCFHRALGSVRPRVRAVARQSLLVIQCLFEALHARTASGRKEPFGQLLKRVSVAVAEAERRVAAAGPADAAQLAYGAQVALPAPDPSTGDGRSLLLDVPAPAHAFRASAASGPGVEQQPGGASSTGAPYFPSQYANGGAGAPPFAPTGSPNELHFGDLSSDWGFDWMTLPQLNLPCGACVKRGAASSCVAAPTKRKKASVDATQDLSARQQGALDELRLFRQTLDSLKARLPALEYYVAHSSSARDEDADELDAVVKSFGDPVTELSGTDPGMMLPSASTSSAGGAVPEPPKKRARVAAVKQDPDESEAAVQAAIDLEFHSLGRPRVWHESNVRPPDGSGAEEDGLASPSIRRAILPPETHPESPVTLFPDARALFDAAPTPDQEDIVFQQGLERFGFHHAVVHAPTFYAQLSAFRDLGEARFEQCSLAWMSMYFALLAVSAKLVEPDQQDEMGWTEAETTAAASRWFLCSVACLYRHNFLQYPDLSCLQAIGLLVLSGRDAGSATLIASLLSSGLSIAQDMGLHRLIPDEQWDAALKGRPARLRAQALVDREVKKRVVWALVHSEWFAIPFKGYSLLSRLQVATPLPLNATDEDLATGELVNRSRDEYTTASWMLQYIEIGSAMASAFEHAVSDKATAAQAYQSFLGADKQLEALLGNLPRWLRTDAGMEGLPERVEMMRSTFLISLQHKILSIHRPFLAKPSRANSYSFSRRRVTEAARAILREAPRAMGNRIWTVLYHISVASFSLTLELYEQLKHADTDNDDIRREILEALPTLEKLKHASAIAERGLGLVLPLLADEQRMRAEGGAMKKDRRRSKKAASTAPYASTNGHASPATGSTASPVLPPATSLPDLGAGSTSAFANPFIPPYAHNNDFGFPAAHRGVLPPFASAPGLHGYDPAAPGPSAAVSGAGGVVGMYAYPPPWLYGEQFLAAPPEATAAPSAASATAGAGAAFGASQWAMHHALIAQQPFGVALGWDWGAGVGGAPPFGAGAPGDQGSGEGPAQP
ncbi:hypothetical protein JCM3770_000517 [Rhodotorula araucariae]